ncbi:transposase [Geobacter sulfurreducens]|nr:transposase [Geobacter sulfurreducens]AJY68106.1 transposase [Geobacter sulfurreducens]AJY68842.1 transposase [Geobacter sulfurreducens]AJY69453.1 transposase [Geobacter sulfurreducens]AJY69574.1 transposase [Geobacter sulfurreducens]
MRGIESQTEGMFFYLSIESFVPKDHPLRPIRAMVDKALAELNPQFEAMYSHTGRPSIPPEQLLKALLLQALYSIRSNRLLVEQINYSILFRWFVGLALDEKVWDHSSFSTNLSRLIDSDVSRLLLAKVVKQARAKKLLSDEHFSVDGTLIEAWASVKSFQPKDGPKPPVGRNKERDFHGEKLKNDTHASTTDPDAKLLKKSAGKEAKLCYLGHAVMENRSGLIVNGMITQASGTAEREAAVEMVAELADGRRKTVGGDKNFDTKDFVEDLRALKVTPHVAQNTTNRSSAIDGRTTRHEGYKISLKVRKRIEEAFGWIKTIGNLRKTRHRGVAKVDWYFTLTIAAYNLVRMRNLGAAA